MSKGAICHGSPRKCNLTPRPVEPEATMDEIIHFVSTNPSTHTRSAFLNAFLSAWEVVRPCTALNLAHYLGVSPNALRGAVQCLTGRPYNDFRTALILGRYKYFHEQKLHLSTDETARKLGLYNRAGLLKILKKHHITPYHFSERTKQKMEKIERLQKEIKRLEHELNQ